MKKTDDLENQHNQVTEDDATQQAEDTSSGKNRVYAAFQSPYNLYEILKILLICLWDIFDKYLHSEHKNLRLFVRLIFNACFVFLLFFIFSKQLEVFVAPSITKIPELQKKLNELQEGHTHVMQKLEEQSQKLQKLNSVYQEELSNLKQKLHAAQQEIQTFKTHPQAFDGAGWNNPLPSSAKTPVSYANFAETWTALKEQVERGEKFDEQLIFAKKFSKYHEQILEQLSVLNEFSLTGVKTTMMLSQDLALIKGKIIFNEGSGDERSLFASLWSKVKNIVNFEKNDSSNHKGSLETVKVSFVTDIDTAISLLAENKLIEAVEILEKCPSMMKKYVESWILEARKRNELDTKIMGLDAQIIKIKENNPF